MKTFDNNKLHQVPTLIMDYVIQLNHIGNTPEVRENYAARLESIKEYCEMVLDKHYQSRKSVFPKLKSAGLRGAAVVAKAQLKND